MKKVAKFHKVSFEQFKSDFEKVFSYSEEETKKVYEEIILPKRATNKSAGYDFFMPVTVLLKPEVAIRIPTGICCEMEESWVLQLYPRSGLGFKFRLQLDNTVGIIDADYFESDNEGHIMAKMRNDSRKKDVILLEQGMGFMQGIFIEYGITSDDQVDVQRNGGFGSTTE
jgi:dUTP pyrophosphatase